MIASLTLPSGHVQRDLGGSRHGGSATGRLGGSGDSRGLNEGVTSGRISGSTTGGSSVGYMYIYISPVIFVGFLYRVNPLK